MGDLAHAEDVVQEAYLRFADAAKGTLIDEPVKYLYRIVRNLAIDGRRQLAVQAGRFVAPPNGYRITGEGQGGVAGFAKSGAVVTLVEEGGETVLKYEVTAQVGGKIAQVGARLIAGTATKLAEQFFAKFVERIGSLCP